MSLSLTHRPNHRLPYTEPARSLEGIHRYRFSVDGKTLWYARDANGEIVALQLVNPGDCEADVVAGLVEQLRGPSARRPKLTIVPRSSSGGRLSMSEAAVLLLLRKL